GRAEARVLAHGPEAATIHRRLHAARVWEIAGFAETRVEPGLGRGLSALNALNALSAPSALRTVYRRDRDSGWRKPLVRRARLARLALPLRAHLPLSIAVAVSTSALEPTKYGERSCSSVG